MYGLQTILRVSRLRSKGFWGLINTVLINIFPGEILDVIRADGRFDER